jgi:hypothetical protein
MFCRLVSLLSFILIPGALLLATGSCASHKRPALYPNTYLKQVGESRAQEDIDACFEFAKSQVAQFGKDSKALTEGAKGATAGAAGGAAAGALSGGGLARGAGTGAAAGAAIGIVRGLWKGSEPDPVFKRFVEQCLRDKGYDPMGWQ